MVAPKEGTFLTPQLYENTFGITSISLNDGSSYKATFIKSKKTRILEEKSEEIFGEASKLEFEPKVEIHSDLEIKIGLLFEQPNLMTLGGVANIEIEVKEPSIFKSAKTLKPIDGNSFKDGKPKLAGEVPPIIIDYEEAKKIA
jgi:hypothetical protein